MKKSAWQGFAAARDRFRALVEALNRELPELRSLQEALLRGRAGPAYAVDTPVVYNGTLDEAGPETEIKLILVGDNPGRREQAAENRRYLVGPSGKIAEKFFRDNPALGIDLRKNVLILNKTPIHTPRTAELRDLALLERRPETGSGRLGRVLAASQRAMAEILRDFHGCLAPAPVWIIGYSEMRRGGVFEAYTEALGDLYRRQRARQGEIFLYRHFSMNQFTIDLNQQRRSPGGLEETLARMGTAYRERILGW